MHTRLAEQWHLNNTGQRNATPGKDIGAVAAWSQSKGESVVVAVIDAGFDDEHPEISGKIAAHADGSRVCRLRVGRQYDTDHGTSCASIIAAERDILGVAPQASIMLWTALDRYPSGRTSYFVWDIVNAIHEAAHVADVVCCSWTLDSPEPSVDIAIRSTARKGPKGHGVVFCFAVQRPDGPPGDGVGFPASLAKDIDHVMAVAATDAHGNRSHLSDYSSKVPTVTLAAPGGDEQLGLLAAICRTAGGYLTDDFCGTSAATAVAAGAAALVRAQWDDLVANDVVNMLKTNATQESGHDPFALGAGRINVGNVFAGAPFQVAEAPCTDCPPTVGPL